MTAGLCPEPVGELKRSPTPPSRENGGLREGRGKEGKEREGRLGGEEGRGGRGKEEGGMKGREGKGTGKRREGKGRDPQEKFDKSSTACARA